MTGWLGLALRRAAHDGPLVVAAALIVLVAAGVLVAASIYPEAVVRGGIVRSLEQADPLASSIGIAIDVRPTDVASIDSGVRDIVTQALAPADGSIGLTARSDGYGILSNGKAPPDGAATAFVFAEGLDAHAHLVRGAWPATGAAAASDVIEAAVSEAGAAAVGVDVGNLATTTSRLDIHKVLEVRIVGVFAANDPGDAFWSGNPLLLGGKEQRGSFTTVGPLFIDREVLLDRAVVARAGLTWRAIPTFPQFTAENVGAIADSVRALGDRLAGRLGNGQAISVSTSLPGLLGAVGGQLAEARSGSTLVAGQLVVLAMYALIFVAALVVGQRRAATGLIRARGAGGRHLVTLALIESVVVAVPAAALGLPLGFTLATVLAGGSGGARLSGDVVVLAGVAALVAIVGLTLPTVVAVGPLAAVRRSPGRQRAAALVQRSRLDLGVVALAGIALWQLRGSESATTIAASPLAIVGPAVGLLAGAILLLRVVPILGSLVERVAVRKRTAERSLVVRSVSRRSVAAARPALLVAIAAAIAVFAGGYGLTWEASQRDQAQFAVGADLRGEEGPAAAAASDPGAVGVATIAGREAGYEAISGVTRAAPLAHEDITTGSAVPHGVLVAIEPESAGAVVPFRADLGTRPFPELLATLSSARPNPTTIQLPATARLIRIHVAIPATVGDTARVSVDVVIRSGAGLLSRFASVPGLGGPGDAFVARLPDAAGSATILAIELHVVGAGDLDPRSVSIASIEANPSEDGGSWSPIDATAALAAWSVVPGPFSTLVARPTSLADVANAPIAALVDPAILASTDGHVGDAVLVRHGFSTSRRIHVEGTISRFPGVSATGVVVVDLASYQLARYLVDGAIPAPDEWRFSITPGSDSAVIAGLAAGADSLNGIRSAAFETAGRLNDPIVIAIGGMLVLSAAAAATFAIIGFLTAAWSSARSRMPEYAVARAMGISRGEVRGWLAAEQAFPALAGVAWGIALGIALEWVVLPSIVHAPGGGAPVPPALVVVPVPILVVSIGVAVVLVVATAVALARGVERAGITEPLRGES